GDQVAMRPVERALGPHLAVPGEPPARRAGRHRGAAGVRAGLELHVDVVVDQQRRLEVSEQIFSTGLDQGVRQLLVEEWIEGEMGRDPLKLLDLLAGRAGMRGVAAPLLPVAALAMVAVIVTRLG